MFVKIFKINVWIYKFKFIIQKDFIHVIAFFSLYPISLGQDFQNETFYLTKHKPL